MIKVTNIKAIRIIGALLILLSGKAFAVTTYATQAGLNTEITNRTAADTAETARAKVAEGTLKAALAKETARAKAAEAASSFSYSMTCGTHSPKNEACKVGTVGPGGGWIFFVDYNDQYPGFTYLEAAPTDIAAVVWCNIDTSIPSAAGWAAKGVGKGKANTTAMLGVCSSGAAKAADLYLTATKSDWFLPSQGELNIMHENLLEAGVGNFVINGYWSSTEDLNWTMAWGNAFIYGGGIVGRKDEMYSVRAIRYF